MAALAALTPCAAAAQPAVPSHPCAAVASGPDRLACYDAAFPPSPVEQAARLEQIRSDFGLREAELQQRQAATAAADVERIEAAVASLERSPRGERIFTLDNGQRWQETNATSRGHVNEGDVVVVEKAAFGTYLLVTPARAGLRVRRIK